MPLGAQRSAGRAFPAQLLQGAGSRPTPLGFVQVERRATKNVVDLLDEVATTNKELVSTNKAVVTELKGMKELLSKQA